MKNEKVCMDRGLPQCYDCIFNIERLEITDDMDLFPPVIEYDYMIDKHICMSFEQSQEQE